MGETVPALRFLDYAVKREEKEPYPLLGDQLHSQLRCG
jgi:hypothetical protein